MTQEFIIYERTILIGMDLAETVQSFEPQVRVQVTLCHERAEVVAALAAALPGAAAILHLDEAEADVLALARERGLRVVLLDAPEAMRRGGVPGLAMPFDPDNLRRLVFSPGRHAPTLR